MGFRVLLRDEENNNYSISYKGLKEQLGVNALETRINYAYDKLLEILTSVDFLLKPVAEKMMLAFIEHTPNIKTREINHFCFMCTGRMGIGLYRAFENLQKEERITATSHGKGHDRTWSITEVRKNGKLKT